MGRVPAATIAAQRVAEVRDRPQGWLNLLQSSYSPLPKAPPLHLRYRRAALAFNITIVSAYLDHRDLVGVDGQATDEVQDAGLAVNS